MRLSERKILGCDARDVLRALALLFVAMIVAGGVAPSAYIHWGCLGAVLATGAGVIWSLRSAAAEQRVVPGRMTVHVAASNGALLALLLAVRLGGQASEPGDPFSEPPPKLNAAQKAIPPLGVTPFDPRPLMETLAARTHADRFRFVVLGGARNSARFPALCALMDTKLKPDFVLTCGDMVLQGAGSMGPACWERFAQDAEKYMRKYPWWPAVGASELRGGAVVTVDREQEFYSQPENPFGGAEAVQSFYDLDSDHYVFTFRNATFIALPPRHPEGEIEAWLAIELYKAFSEGRHIFVFNSTPFFSLGSHGRLSGAASGAVSLFGLYNVRAVFSAQDRLYYRTCRENVPFIVCGGAGPAPERAEHLARALPDDVYYVRADAADGAGGRNFVLHNGAGAPGDQFMAKPLPFVVVVDVDGPSAKLNCMGMDGRTLDTLDLGPRK